MPAQTPHPLLHAPLRILFFLLSSAFKALRPHAPRLVPLIVCALFIPLVILLSLSAGWIVFQSLSKAWQVPLFLQYGDGPVPYAQARLPDMLTRQRYDISVHLIIPALPSNTGLGNFMTSMTLTTPYNVTLLSVRRPSIVFPPPAFFFSSAPTVITVNVPLVDAFVPSTTPILANVEIGRRDGWKSLGDGHGRELSVLSASLHGQVIRRGIHGLAIRFPITFSVVSALTFFTVISSVLASCILPVMFRHSTSLNEKEKAPIEDAPRPREDVKPLSPPSYESEETLVRRRSRVSRSLGSDTRIKREVPVLAMPQANIPTERLRRRHSQQLHNASESDA